MSSPTWTPVALSSKAVPFEGEAWRVVEAQHRSATMKLTDTLDEQRVLEELVEATKPSLPEACRHLHFLLAAPFRYWPYPHGSRFRKPGNTPGVFYCSAESRTAIAELAFYRLLFFAESPDTPWPSNPSEYNAFSVALGSERMLDLADAAFDADRAALEHPTDYAMCQDLETQFRGAGGEVIRYRSVRDRDSGSNYAVLSCSVFRAPDPIKFESWKLYLGAGGIRAMREFPFVTMEFDRAAFANDRRVAEVRWDRTT